MEAKKTASYQFMERSWQEQRDRVRQAKETLDCIEGLLGTEPAAPVTESRLSWILNGDELTVENHRYRLTLDTLSGKILSVYDRTLDSVILEAGDEGIFSYRYDRYGLPDVTEFLRSYGYHFTTWGIQDYGRENYPDCEHETFYPEFAGWEVLGRELHLHYDTGKSSADYGDGRAVCLNVTFPEEGDELMVTLKLENKQESPFIESGSLIFPFVGKASYRIGKPGGVIDPETQIQRLCNHALFNLERQVTVQTGRGNVSICSLDVPLFGIGSPGVYEFHKTFGEGWEPILYFNLFNNMWGTNFPQWIGGNFRYRFILRSNVADPQAWAAELCCGETAAIPKGMELLSTRVENGVVYIMLRDLTGVGKKQELRVDGADICAVNLLRKPASNWCRDSFIFQTRPYGIHVFALRKVTV